MIEDDVIVKSDDSDNARWTVQTERLKTLRVPPTLTGVLQARLDTLDPMARLLLGRASVIGRIFWASAVDYLHKADGFHIHKAEALLEDLREREMIFLREKSDFGGTQEYVIKHAILRDVVYESLLKRQQREYHKAAAEWLIEVSDERADEYTGLIAEHYELANEPVKAAEHLLTAGKQANAVAAFEEAKILLDHALAILPEEGGAPKQMRVYVQIEQMEIYSRRWQTTEVNTLGQQVLTLAREVDDKTSLAYVLAQLSLNAGRLGQVEASQKFAQEADTLVDEIDDPKIKLYVLRQIGNYYTLTAAGSVEKGLKYFEQSLAIAHELNDLDGEASAYNAIGNAYSMLNQLPEAIAVYEKGASIAHEVGDDSILAIFLMNIAEDYFFMQDYQKAIATNLDALKLLEKIGADLTPVRTQLAKNLVQMDTPANRDDAINHIKFALESAITANNLALLQETIEIFTHVCVNDKEYERAAELIGLWRTSPLFDAEDKLFQLHVNQSLKTIAEHLSEAEIEAAIKRGEGMDMMTVAKKLLIELEV